MGWELWEQPHSCPMQTHTDLLWGIRMGEPSDLLHFILGKEAHTLAFPVCFSPLLDTHTRTHTNTKTHVQTDAHSEVVSWLGSLGGPGKYTHLVLSLCLPPLWHVVISRVQMFRDIFTHTWWQTTLVVSPVCPSSNRLLQPWPDPQPVYKGLDPTSF